MRRLTVAAALAFLTGCTSPNEPLRFDETATMLSVLDPRADKQLTRGFFPVEGSGRWTARLFSATLKPPPNAARKGAVLVLRFGIPASSIEALHSIQVSAQIAGVRLAPEEYRQAGEFEYRRDAPAEAFRDRGVTVDFTLDKAFGPHEGERRELGVVVSTVGFEAK